jgi:DNA-binding response OmpR family regulator
MAKVRGTILILEDEAFIALDLQLAIEDQGLTAAVAATVEQALAIVRERRLLGAILDVNLGGGFTCWPVAHALTDAGVPFVLHTGDLNREGERLRHFEVPIVSKPAISEDVVDRLLSLIESPGAPSEAQTTDA